MKNKPNKKTAVALVTLFSVLAIGGIAFAALSANLYINGSAKVKNSDFSVIWQENSMLCSPSGEAKVVSASNTETTAAVSAEFKITNDSVTCNVTAENDGTIDASFVASNLVSNISSLSGIDVTSVITSPGGTTPTNHTLATGLTRGWRILLTYVGSGVEEDSSSVNFSYTIPYVEAE